MPAGCSVSMRSLLAEWSYETALLVSSGNVARNGSRCASLSADTMVAMVVKLYFDFFCFA